MSIFSKALELLIGKQKEKELQEQLNRIEKKIEEKPVEYKYLMGVDPYRGCKNKVIYNVNTQSVTVVDCEGNSYSGITTSDVVDKLKTATTEEIIALLTPPKVEEKTKENNVEQEEKEIVSNFLDIFDGVDDFEVVGNSVFFKGIRSVEIPSLIVARFVELLEQIKEYANEGYSAIYERGEKELEYQSLKAFTLKLLLNPLKESRDHALEFVRNFDIKLTNTGNMIMYRRIVSKSNTNKALVEFVSKQYLKVKSWKKSPRNYFVNKERLGYNSENQLILSEKSYMLVKSDIEYLNKEGQIGNLAELYNNLSELKENRYTDDYTKTYDIRIGATYKIREQDIDLNKNGSCGGALHVADGKVFNYSSFGNTPVCVIVNPMHIYKMDSGCSGKIGVKQMFVAAVTTQDENGNYEDIDNQDLVNFDELYHNESLEELQKALKTKSLEATSVSTAISEVSLKDVESISNMLKSRVVNI